MSDADKGPVDATEIAASWAALLGGRSVGEDDDFFFDLGGHSLLGAAIVTTLAERTGLPLELQDLYLSPTPREFAGHLAELAAALSRFGQQLAEGWELAPFLGALAELGAAAADSLLPADAVLMLVSGDQDEQAVGAARLRLLRQVRGVGQCTVASGPAGWQLDGADGPVLVRAEIGGQPLTLVFCEQ